MKLTYILFLSISFILFCRQDANSYSMDMHRKITEEVIDQNTANLNNYLGNIGLTNGIIEFINKKVGTEMD